MEVIAHSIRTSIHRQDAYGTTTWLNASNYGRRKIRVSSCRASMRNTHQEYEYDFYELLSVDKNASLQEIRRSYRWLQKKCHPDIAGDVGHDMSILLNQAYTTLADPDQRAIYDQSVADSSELQGYTGSPLYSKWLGPSHEERAVFVDESHCVGCLKCALIAPNTFAIESRYGRARVVGQWGDSKRAIGDAIKACPVDCITWVERCQLAALEFVMSKEPRVPVGFNVHNNGGVRPSDVFKGAEKLMEKIKQQEQQKKKMHTTETPAQREARLAAMEGVHVRSGRWWLNSTYNTRHGNVNHEFGNELNRLLEAAKKRRQGAAASPGGGAYDDEYWVPLSKTDGLVLLPLKNEPTIQNMEKGYSKAKGPWLMSGRLNTWMDHVVSGGPIFTAILAAWFVGMTSVPGVALSTNEMGAGLLPANWVQSMELQVVSAAAVWYLVGAVFANTFILLVNLLQMQSKKTSD
ncbi:hypothetical protein KP509_30G020400 [Ceratopteris richardii]|uniref:J domain-containing protein n=1 Tax=Ceratopteris richardii TaxID=49495 RepID=A0A8T2R282_CERRI|nr:hypothetical protein KP509_30G020400 [Ceratopteris richardii]